MNELSKFTVPSGHQIEPPAAPIQKATVTMTIYQWHLLIAVLDSSLMIVNHNREPARMLMEEICTQLHNVPVKVKIE